MCWAWEFDESCELSAHKAGLVSVVEAGGRSTPGQKFPNEGAAAPANWLNRRRPVEKSHWFVADSQKHYGGNVAQEMKQIRGTLQGLGPAVIVE